MIQCDESMLGDVYVTPRAADLLMTETITEAVLAQGRFIAYAHHPKAGYSKHVGPRLIRSSYEINRQGHDILFDVVTVEIGENKITVVHLCEHGPLEPGVDYGSMPLRRTSYDSQDGLTLIE